MKLFWNVDRKVRNHHIHISLYCETQEKWCPLNLDIGKKCLIYGSIKRTGRFEKLFAD